MKYVGVTFPNSSKIYTYKTKINLKRGVTYDITADNVTRYTSPVTVVETNLPKPTDFVVREITRAVKVPTQESRIEDLIKHVTYNYKNGITTVVWKDGGYTTVTIQEGEKEWSKEKAICMAFVKRAYGNTGRFNNFLNKWVEEGEVKC